MKVLIVCSGNTENFNFETNRVFIYEQIRSIQEQFNIDYDTCFITGKGFNGYINGILAIKRKVREYKPNVIHAHYGLSGLVSCLQRRVPVIVTFLGSDAHILPLLSKIASSLSAYNIFVEESMSCMINNKKPYSIIPFGVDMEKFYPMEQNTARELMGMDEKKKYILFSSSFNNPIKDYPLAKRALDRLDFDVVVVELRKNKSREEVNLLFNACDLALLTSKREGSPQFIKEAMACNCPIVATDVGDIRNIIGTTEGCFLTSFDPEDIAKKINAAIIYGIRTDGRTKIKRYDNECIAGNIYHIYDKI